MNKRKVKVIGVNKCLQAAQVGERRVDADIARREVILRKQVREFLDRLDRLVVIVVHLPVAADQWRSCGAI